MKIKSLLAAVSLAAITAGSANALTIDNVLPAAVVPALELELPGDPALSGNFSFDVITNTGSTYPGGNNLVVDVTLPQGVAFTTAVTGGSIAGAVTSATVQSGGAVGGQTVQFLVAVPQPASDTLTFNFDLGLNSCPIAGSPLTVNIETELGTPVEQGLVQSSGLIAPCASGLDGVVTSDDDVSDTIILLSGGYTTIGNGATSANLPGVLGSINMAVDPTVSTSLSSIVPIAPTDIEEIEFDVVFEDASAVTSLFVNGIPSTKSGNVFTVTATSNADVAKLIDGVADSIFITVDGTTVIETQTVSVQDTVVTFDDGGGNDMIDSEAGPSGALDTLQREGRAFGFFDWNSGAAGSQTLSIYRITGLEAGESVDYTLTLENSNNNGTYPGVITANDFGEASLVSSTMPIPADTIRFDVLINLETAGTGIDVDRLLIREGIVTDFGGNANNSGVAPAINNTPDIDSDQLLGSE